MIRQLAAFIEGLDFSNPETLGLAIGILLGLVFILLLRARQVWSNRRAFGYDVYTAGQVRRRLLTGSILGVFAIVVVVIVYGWHLDHTPEPAPPPALTLIDEAGESVEARLLIPKLAVDTVMIEAQFVGNHWDISRLTTEVAHLAGTAYPGEPGNTVLAGHVTVPDAGWGPFKDLETMQVGDRIFVEQGPLTFVYVVEELKTVAPTDVEIAFPTQEERLTLLTCSGWSDTLDRYAERLVVVARRLE